MIYWIVVPAHGDSYYLARTLDYNAWNCCPPSHYCSFDSHSSGSDSLTEAAFRFLALSADFRCRYSSTTAAIPVVISAYRAVSSHFCIASSALRSSCPPARPDRSETGSCCAAGLLASAWRRQVAHLWRYPVRSSDAAADCGTKDRPNPASSAASSPTIRSSCSSLDDVQTTNMRYFVHSSY